MKTAAVRQYSGWLEQRARVSAGRHGRHYGCEYSTTVLDEQMNRLIRESISKGPMKLGETFKPAACSAL